jgi:RNA polymerase sigma factor (sigma-70 family)
MSGPHEDPDVFSMSRLREGDDLALNEIMDRWQRRLTSYLIRLTGSEAVAMDLAQETFVRVYQNRARYRPTGAFSTWLFAMASNLARHHIRWKIRHPCVKPPWRLNNRLSFRNDVRCRTHSPESAGLVFSARKRSKAARVSGLT